MILQYTTADVKERARDGARVLPGYMGKAMGGFRLMRHVCRHVRITIIVIIGLARLLCVLALFLSPSARLARWTGVRQDWVSRSDQGRAGRTHQNRRRRDEGELVLDWLGVVHLLCRLRTCLPSSPLETGAMKGKKRVSAQNPPQRREG